MADVICRNIRGLIYSRNEILGENSTIEQELDSIKSELCCMSNSIKDLSQEKCKSKQEINQLDEENNIYVEEAKRREEIYHQKKCEMKHLCKENECLAARCKQLEKETCETKEELAAYESFLCELKNSAEQIDLKAETLLYQNKESKDVVSNLHSRVSQIKKCLRELSEDLKCKCIYLDKVFQNLKHSESARDQLECKEAEIRRQVLELQTKLCTIQSKLQGEQASNEKLHDKIEQGECLLEDLHNNLDIYERETKKIERRKECHLKEILNVINEVKDDIKVQQTSCRKSASREKPARVSWSSSGEYNNIKKPVEPKLSRRGMPSEMRNYYNPQNLFKKGPQELPKCRKPESDVFRTATRLDNNDSDTMRPKNIDSIRIRNTKETIRRKKSEGCKDKNSCRCTAEKDARKKEKKVDEIIRELLRSDIMLESNECSNDTIQ